MLLVAGETMTSGLCKGMVTLFHRLIRFWRHNRGMDERRKNLRIRARIQCNLMISATGKRYTGNTKNISLGGAEFEAAESMTRAGQAVAVGTPAILTFMLRRGSAFQELKMQCRVRFVSANIAGLEYTASMPTLEERTALEKMLETRSSRLD